MSKVVCSACGAQCRAPENAAGKRFRCPKCGGVISVPAAARVAAGTATGPAAAAATRVAPTASGARALVAIGRGAPVAILRPPQQGPPRPSPAVAPKAGQPAPRPAPPPMPPAYAAPPAVA